MFRRRSTMALAAALMLVMAACGDGEGGEPSGATTNAAPSVVEAARVDVPLIAVCGFAPLGDVRDPQLPTTSLSQTAVAALDPYLAATDAEMAFFSEFDWYLAEETGTHIRLFGLPKEPGVDGYGDVEFELVDGSWTAVAFGYCRPGVSTGEAGRDWGLATWILDPDHEPDPESTMLRVLINERNCASGSPPVGRELALEVIEDDDELIVTVLVEPVAGGATCPGNPWHPVVLDLGTAPSGRLLFDGSELPAEERRWPPDHPDYFG